MDTTEQLLSIKDVAQWLGLRQPQLRAKVREGNGPPHLRIGKLIKFRRQSVERWLDEQEQ